MPPKPRKKYTRRSELSADRNPLKTFESDPGLIAWIRGKIDPALAQGFNSIKEFVDRFNTIHKSRVSEAVLRRWLTLCGYSTERRTFLSVSTAGETQSTQSPPIPRLIPIPDGPRWADPVENAPPPTSGGPLPDPFASPNVPANPFGLPTIIQG
jgi:hypothetical protein